jgi:hypothetical protein
VLLPAIDRYQHIVVNALQKVGWRVEDVPYVLRVGRRSVFVDLTAQRINEDAHEQIIILEVKSFEDQSPVHSLEVAVGQYVIYRALFKEQAVDHPLYLAVPSTAFNGILSESIGLIVRKQLGLKLLVFDIDREEIVEWIH